MAIDTMRRYQIPASVTLGQAAMESGWATSTLAREGNNLFGIKCGPDWHGASMLRNDDAPNECFRVYPSVQDSFEDHAKFLHKYGRYSGLFKLDPGDYESWFRGLKAAGYGTDPLMADKLISIANKYNLGAYDSLILKSKKWITWAIGALVFILVLLIVIYFVRRHAANKHRTA